MTIHTDPQTPAEWQECVDFAHAFLLIESAREYGLITGGPVIDTARCETMLARGKALGYEPRDTDAVLLAIVQKWSENHG